MIEQAEMVLTEVERFEPETRLNERVRLVVGNKADGVISRSIGRKRLAALEEWVERRLGKKQVWDESSGSFVSVPNEEAVQIKLISGKWGQGIRELAFRMGELVVQQREEDALAREERKRAEREAEEDAIRELQRPILRIEDVPDRKEAIGYGLKEDADRFESDDAHVG